MLNTEQRLELEEEEARIRAEEEDPERVLEAKFPRKEGFQEDFRKE